MQVVEIYAVVAGGCFLTLVCYRLGMSLLGWVQDRTIYWFFKYLVYPVLIRRHSWIGPCSRWQALSQLVYWSMTATCNVVGIRNIAQFGDRAGIISLLHLIPLLFGDRLSFAADVLGVSLHTYHRLHGTIGFMAILQASMHSLVFVLQLTLQLRERKQLYGFLVRTQKF